MSLIKRIAAYVLLMAIGFFAGSGIYYILELVNYSPIKELSLFDLPTGLYFGLIGMASSILIGYYMSKE